MARRHTLYLALSAVLLLVGCSGGGSSSASNPPLSAMAALGDKIFHDTNLSAGSNLACSTCHAQATGLANDNGAAVMLGGPALDEPGLRNTPSLTYTAFTPQFSLTGDGPSGGFFRDGRAKTLADQARAPFTNEFEMANADAAAVVAKLNAAKYKSQFIAIFGANQLSDPSQADAAMASIGMALVAYEKEDASFKAFNSKYDAWRAGTAQLTAQELRGFALFNSPAHGNCAACHPSTSADGVTPPLFTDFSYDNLGVPRNTSLEANNDSTTLSYVIALQEPNYDGVHKYYDIGVCGPLRTDISHNYGNSGICGAFKVPTLRNIALTAPYFHNGKFSTLSDALSFYVTRDTDPGAWYPTSGNIVTKFDDLPAIYGGQFQVDLTKLGSDVGYVGNVNTAEAPYNRKLGDAPALSPSEIKDVIAFLCTLNDGYDPNNAVAYIAPQQCIDAQVP